MIIKDTQKGMFQLESKKNVVVEVIEGLWKNEDYARYTDAYEKDMIREVKKMGKWAKLCDMREYKMSSVVDEVSKHVKWCSENGLQESVCVVPSAIVKMQMTRTAKDTDTKKELIQTHYVATVEEAEAYLKQKGYL